MVHDVEVQIDGEKEDRSLIYFSCDGEDFFTLDESGDSSRLQMGIRYGSNCICEKAGRTEQSTHKVTLSTVIRKNTYLCLFPGTRTVEVTIE